MKSKAKLSWFAGVAAVVAVLLCAVPYARNQFKSACQRAAILKMPVLDFFPNPRGDGRKELLVVIANRSDENIAPIEFSILASNGASQINPIGNIIGQPIAPAAVGVVLTEYSAASEPVASVVTMTAKIRYLGRAERTELLLVTRQLH